MRNPVNLGKKLLFFFSGHNFGLKSFVVHSKREQSRTLPSGSLRGAGAGSKPKSTTPLPSTTPTSAAAAAAVRLRHRM